jgi:hypothetical protein
MFRDRSAREKVFEVTEKERQECGIISFFASFVHDTKEREKQKRQKG